MRAKLVWITKSGPDIACTVAFLEQVTEERCEKDALHFFKRINEVVKHLKASPNRVMRYSQLYKICLKLQVYTDASFLPVGDAH